MKNKILNQSRVVVFMLFAIAAASRADVVFFERFGTGPADVALSTVDWHANVGSTATGYDDSRVFTSNPIASMADFLFCRLSHSGVPWLGWTDKASIADIGDIGSVTNITVDLKNNSASENLKIALKVNNEWYVSQEVLNNPDTLQFYTVRIAVQSVSWNRLVFVSGSTLAEGGSVSLPSSGNVQAIGIFDASSTSDSVRVDNFTVATNPGNGGPAILRAAHNTLPDALAAVPGNTSPGKEYQAASRFYQGIPGIERHTSGRLWACWYSGGRGECGDNYVLAVTSGDEGVTWTNPVLVIDPPGAIRAFDPCLWSAPDGRLFLFYAQSDSSEGLHDGRWGVWFTVCEHPDRGDSSWTEPVRICDGIMMNQPTVLRDGSWRLPVAMWKDKQHGAGIVRSMDNGKTFEWIGGAGGGLEHMIIERTDGSLWMLIRTQGARGGEEGLLESVSRDGGVTWSPSQVSAIKSPGSRFHLKRLRSGQLLLINHEGYDPSGHPVLEQRSRLTAMLSEDDGRTWPCKLLLDERKGISYPDAVEGQDDKIYIIYDHGRHNECEILMAVTSEKDISAGSAGPDTRLKVLVDRAAGKRGR